MTKEKKLSMLDIASVSNDKKDKKFSRTVTITDELSKRIDEFIFEEQVKQKRKITFSEVMCTAAEEYINRNKK